MTYLHPSDRTLYLDECVLITLVLATYTLWLALAALRRRRPDLSIGRAVAAAFVLRVLAAVGVGQLSMAQDLRGGDELTFLGHAHDLARDGIGSAASMDALTTELHSFVFSLNLRAFRPDPPLLALRVEMIALSVLGLALIATAAYELAGPRAARITAWLLALEPTNIFFSSILHKEPLMFLAEGAVAFGGAVLWKRGSLSALVPMILGCLVAVATRPYAGWFLAVAAAIVILHASVTRQQGIRAFALVVAMLGLSAAFVPVVWNASSDRSLKELQQSQDANAADTEANLSLERVDYSTRTRLVTNLPKRISDVILRPYPWQTQNTSQRLGVIGTLVLFFALATLVMTAGRGGSAVMARAGPLVYPALLLLIAYSLSAGNAGTAYRYRTHVVGLVICLIVVLRAHLRSQAASERARETAGEPAEWRRAPAEPELVT